MTNKRWISIRLTTLLAGVIVLIMLLTTIPANLALADSTNEILFNYTGGMQQWVVPEGVTSIDVDVRGAQGGTAADYYDDTGGPGGPGGRVETTLSVTPGETLYIYVGGAGSGGVGGYNGGGSGGSGGGYGGSGGGGGASDIRQGGNALSNRIVVAGGGGGGKGYYASAPTGPYGGGLGGGLVGGDGPNHFDAAYGGKGGTQSSGGDGGSEGTSTYGHAGYSGSLSLGGAGGPYYASGVGGGGGGGYYGGGGGASDGAGGGGGSSYSIEINTTHTQGYQLGNGLIIISYIAGECPPFPAAGFQDDFLTFDYCIWEKTEENVAGLNTTFMEEHANVSEGNLVLEVPMETREGGQIQTLQMLGYGKYEARIQASGVNSTVQGFFVSIHNDQPGGHGEIDIEFGLQENVQNITFGTWMDKKKNEGWHWLESDPSEGFHEYGFYWYPCGVEFYVDGEHVWTSVNLIPEEPCFLMFNNWVKNYTPVPTQDSVMLVEWVRFEPFPETGMPCFIADHGIVEDLEALPTIPPGAPAGIVFPYGMFSFRITGLELGQEVTLTVELPGPVPVGTKWWKYQAGSWYPLDIGDDDGDNTITVMLKDGVFPGDEDSIGGQIIDPGGPGGPGTVGWETYPVSKARVLLPWIVLLVAVIVGTGLLILRHRKRGARYI